MFEEERPEDRAFLHPPGAWKAELFSRFVLGRKPGEPFDRSNADAYALDQFQGSAQIDSMADGRARALEAFVSFLRDEGFLTLARSPTLLLDDQEHQLQVAMQPREWERRRKRREKTNGPGRHLDAYRD